MNILITGADRGIGYELTKQYAQKEDVTLVFACCLDPENGYKHEKVQTLRMDVTNLGEIQAVQAELQDINIDILINNAGVYSKNVEENEGSTEGKDLDYEDIIHTYDVNTLGALRVSKTFLSNVQKSERKLITAISSRAGSIGGRDKLGCYGYAMSKCALNAMLNLFQLEHPDVEVLTLHPGWVKTAMGGADAPITAEESVKGLLKVMESKCEFGFYDFQGHIIPW